MFFQTTSHVELARFLLARQKDIIRAFADNLWVYRPNRGVWGLVPETIVRQDIASLNGAKCKQYPKVISLKNSDITGIYRCMLTLAADPELFMHPIPGIALSNGFACLDADARLVLQSHAESHRCIFAHDFPYEPELDTSEIAALMRSFFKTDDDCDEKVRLLQEFFGAALFGLSTRYQKCIILSGGGNEGKDTCVEILKRAFPPHLVSNIPPKKWGIDHHLAELQGKHLNVVGELPAESWDEPATVKGTITGTPQRACRKYRDPFDFVPVAGHIFLANKLPHTRDFSEGYWRRFIIVEFTRKIPEVERIRDLHKLWDTPERIAQVVMWMLQGVENLLERGDYLIPQSHERASSAWRVNSDQVMMWFCSRTAPPLNKGSTPGAECYRAFRTWADECGHKSMSRTEWGLRVDAILKQKRPTWEPSSKYVGTNVFYPFRVFSEDGQNGQGWG